jgi:hypothetical protein
MRLNYDTAKENHSNSSMVNNVSYGATTSPSSQHSITRGADDEEDVDDEEVVRLEAEEPDTAMENISRKSQWILLAVASGACAAFNGVFAKLYVVAFPFSARALHCMAWEGFSCLSISYAIMRRDVIARPRVAHTLVFALAASIRKHRIIMSRT